MAIPAPNIGVKCHLAGEACGGLVAAGPRRCLAVVMADEEISNELPSDEHLRQDVAPDAEGGAEDVQEKEFLPGQTNAGQQVAGLASATGYGKNQDPEESTDGNNPV